MHSKSSIAFLLNPETEEIVSQEKASLHYTVQRLRLSALLSPDDNPSVISPSSKPLRLARRLPPLWSSRQVVSPTPSSCDSSASDCEPVTPSSTASAAVAAAAAAAKPKRKRRIRVRVPTPCVELGCDNYAVTKGRCVRHGGGARCEYPGGCEKRAKLHKLCFQHGGYRRCLQHGCESKAKRYGYCWAHGGGITCAVDGCDKVCTQGGRCWAHGGGSRCRVDGCTRRSYQKDDYLCSHHLPIAVQLQSTQFDPSASCRREPLD
ncbi:hypothetical protein PINS_up001052 [Pythium insidiosum]|nr:hypothetical protein PINS_up001052 [Pythium insidiosum]